MKEFKLKNRHPHLTPIIKFIRNPWKEHTQKIQHQMKDTLAQGMTNKTKKYLQYLNKEEKEKHQPQREI